MEANVTREMLIEEIKNIPQSEYGNVLEMIQNLRKSKKKTISDEEILNNIFSLEGILENEPMGSVELQHSFVDIIMEKHGIIGR
jgi:hypothetical protein